MNRKPATLNKMKSTLSALYRQGKHRDKVKVNPARDVRQRNVRGGVIRFLTPEEETRLLNVLLAQMENKGKRWQYKEAQLENRQITLRDTKNGSSRIVYMIDDVVAAFRTLVVLAVARCEKGQIPRQEDAVFAIEGNKKWWGTALTEAKITDMRWHDLRHTFCSRLAQNGASLKIDRPRYLWTN